MNFCKLGIIFLKETHISTLYMFYIKLMDYRGPGFLAVVFEKEGKLPDARGGGRSQIIRQREIYCIMHCRGMARALYILCIEHLRLMRLSRESNQGPPALHANTLFKAPVERHY